MRFLWFDTETTGLETKDSGIFEIAMIAINSDKEETREKTIYMNPLGGEIVYHDDSGKVHGYTKEAIERFEPERVAVYRIAAFLNGAMTWWNKDKSEKLIPVGYNVKFDIAHLSETLKRHGLSYSNYFRGDMVGDIFEQVKRAQKMGKLPRYMGSRALSAVCERFGISFSAHDAMADIKATQELAKSLQGLGVPIYGEQVR